MAKVEQRMAVVRGDITTLKVQGIVNAANGTLLGGGGVDGAIHKAAGPRLREECEGLDGCPTGEARITRGYHLPARYVIHAVGPVYRGGRKGEADQLAGCYRHSLKLAMEYALSSIAFPCISTGAYSYPPEAAARIAIRTVEDWLKGHELPEQIIFCCFLESDEAIYRKLLAGAG